MPWVHVAKDRKSFVLEPSGKPFTPWGFNYDHDTDGRLIEDYWVKEWDKVEAHFGQMKKLGANVVRIHLQVAKFMDAADKPNEKALDQLTKLVRLAEKERLYLDLTGLGCYHKADVPVWYDKLSEKDRWDAQASFWEAVAGRCARSPAIFCYDLMNEPVVPGGKRKDGDWLGPPFGGKHFVQVITLDQQKRPRPDIARQWIKQLVSAIRKHDKRRLITVGLVDWSLDRPGLTSGFVPDKIADDLDFICVHLYPEKGKLDEAMKTLAAFDVGKPVVIEETFPLKCSVKEFGQFVEGSKKHAAGWIGFYWGKPPEELRQSKTIHDSIMLAWLEYFQKAANQPAVAQEKPIVGVIPKAQKPIAFDGKLTGWDGAFVTPVHVGHPDFANRGGQFHYLWDEKNLYIGLKCLDQKPAHVGKDSELYNGDAVEFYLDTRRGDKLGAAPFGPGTLHMFYTAFTMTDLKPRLQVRPLPAFKDLKLQGAEVAAARTAWGYTAEFKLPWANFPDFVPKVGESIGIDCELCSSDGGPRVDRTFVYSGPAAVGSPSAFGRVQLVDKIDAGSLKPYGRVLLPLSLTKSANYAWLYGTACVSPTIEASVTKLEGKLLDAGGKVRKASTGSKKTQDGGFTLWTASWEMFDLPPGVYVLELTATDKTGASITSRSEKVIHGNPPMK